MKSYALLLGLCLFAGPSLAADKESPEVLYEVYCAQCHGLKGDGRGINAPSMTTEPADHTDASLMGEKTDQELFEIIKFGGKAGALSGLMPRWEGNLSDQEIKDLVSYLRILCCKNK